VIPRLPVGRVRQVAPAGQAAAAVTDHT